MGLFKPRHAQKRWYKYLLVFGATDKTVQERLAFMREEWLRNVRWDEVILLGSARLLDKRIENTTKIRTESDMLLSLWSKTKLPQELKDVPVLIGRYSHESGKDWISNKT